MARAFFLPLLALTVAAGTSPVAVAGPAALYGEVCATCHGAQAGGDEAQQAPPLAGQYDWYLTAQLEKFRAGHRGADAEADPAGATMKAMADTLTKADLASLAGYIARLPAPAATAAWPKGDAANGRGYYEICAACHGSAGEGNVALHAPRLAGQPGWYLYGQLMKFRQGGRGSAAADTLGQQMKSMAEVLPNDTALHDVVAYIISLR